MAVFLYCIAGHAAFRSCSGLQRIFHDIEVIGVYDGRFAERVGSFEVSAVVGMSMSVEKEFRFIFFHQCPEDGKPPMGQIFHIVDLIGGRMGNENIKSFMFP